MSNYPDAKKINKEMSIHGDVRIDPYYWMNDREDSTVISHLEAENAYYAEMTGHTKDFQAKSKPELCQQFMNLSPQTGDIMLMHDNKKITSQSINSGCNRWIFRQARTSARRVLFGGSLPVS